MPAYKGIFVSDPAEFTATLGSESVTIVFDKSKQTLRRDRDLKRAAEAGDIDAMVRELIPVLVGWDVVDEAGQPVPLSADVLLDLPAAALTSLMTFLGEAGQPSSEEGNGSSVPSSPRPPEPSTASSPPPSESQPTPQNGQQPSPSPTPSASPSPT